MEKQVVFFFLKVNTKMLKNFQLVRLLGDGYVFVVDFFGLKRFIGPAKNLGQEKCPRIFFQREI